MNTLAYYSAMVNCFKVEDSEETYAMRHREILRLDLGLTHKFLIKAHSYVRFEKSISHKATAFSEFFFNKNAVS
jgi:hypothetical protein